MVGTQRGYCYLFRTMNMWLLVDRVIVSGAEGSHYPYALQYFTYYLCDCGRYHVGYGKSSFEGRREVGSNEKCGDGLN